MSLIGSARCTTPASGIGVCVGGPFGGCGAQKLRPTHIWMTVAAMFLPGEPPFFPGTGLL